MSVPKNQRGLSKMEFFHKAYEISDKVTTLLIRNFGVKTISRELKTFTRNAKMTHEDREQFTALCNKYRIDVESEYPLWLVEHYRNWIMKLLADLINNITIANTIYPAEPYLDFETKLRRQYQQLAIANCYQIFQALQQAGRVLPVDFEKIMPYVEMVNEEIRLLKEWRKSGNKKYRAFLNNEKEPKNDL